MPRKPRDYKAEERRRNELARTRGYRNRAEQRRKIERGDIIALAPNRLRSKRVIEIQDAVYGIFGREASWLRNIDVQDARIDMAQRWSDWYSRSPMTQFDAERARRDERYLHVYIQAFPLNMTGDRNAHHFNDDPYIEEYFVNLMEIYSADEFDDRYSDS